MNTTPHLRITPKGKDTLRQRTEALSMMERRLLMLSDGKRDTSQISNVMKNVDLSQMIEHLVGKGLLEQIVREQSTTKDLLPKGSPEEESPATEATSGVTTDAATKSTSGMATETTSRVATETTSGAATETMSGAGTETMSGAVADDARDDGRNEESAKQHMLAALILLADPVESASVRQKIETTNNGEELRDLMEDWYALICKNPDSQQQAESVREQVNRILMSNYMILF